MFWSLKLHCKYSRLFNNSNQSLKWECHLGFLESFFSFPHTSHFVYTFFWLMTCLGLISNSTCHAPKLVVSPRLRSRHLKCTIKAFLQQIRPPNSEIWSSTLYFYVALQIEQNKIVWWWKCLKIKEAICYYQSQFGVIHM